MDAAYGAADNYSLKTLVLYGHNDEIIPQEPVLDAFDRFPLKSGSEKELILYKNGYHMLLRDLQAENVMNDIVAWINDD
jgi:alpha-beta hydrolase superfamily lysophospholipase